MKFNKITENYLSNKPKSYVNKDDEINPDFIRFDAGEDYLIENKASNFFNLIKDIDIKSYPDNTTHKLKESIAKMFNISVSQIVLGNGSDEFIENIPRMILEKNDSSLVINPTFFRFSDSVKRAGGIIESINLKEEKSFDIDEDIADEIIQKANSKNIRLLWLCNPNNPTGNIIKKDLIVKILDSVSCPVVIDEVFFEFYDSLNKDSAIHLIKNYDNLLVVRSLSKANGLAGLRVGYAVANQTIIEELEKYRLPYNIPSISQVIASNEINDLEKFKNHINKVNEIRKEFINKLKSIPNVIIGGNSKTNVFLLRVKDKKIYQMLLKNGIICANFDNCPGLEGQGYVRVTIRSKEDNDIFIEKLKEAVRNGSIN